MSTAPLRSGFAETSSSRRVGITPRTLIVVEVEAQGGMVGDGALVHAPGTRAANRNGFAAVAEPMAEADASLATDPAERATACWARPRRRARGGRRRPAGRRRRALAGGDERGEQRQVEAVALVGAVEADLGDAGVDGDEHARRGVGHGPRW